MRRLLTLIPAVGLVFGLGLSACIYIPDVQQGNVITQEMIDKLRPGLSPQQVRFVLGTPLVSDPFHKARWDYLYSFRDGKTKTIERRRLTVIFEDGKLARIVVEPTRGTPDNGTTAKPPVYGSSPTPRPGPISSNPPALMQQY